MLQLENVSITYGGIRALSKLCLRVNHGEIVALIGANGAGKSTSLRGISGLVPLAGGRITFDGTDISGIAAEMIVDLGIVHVPEGRRVFPRLTVEENLNVGAYNRRARGRERATRDEVYQLFPRLSERRSHFGGYLSGGEQQMLAFGRAMMAHPRLLLLDEPSLGLAPMIVAEVAAAISRLHEAGVTILLVEQNAELALAMSDRGYVLQAGELVLTNSGESLLKNPEVWESYLGRGDLTSTELLEPESVRC